MNIKIGLVVLLAGLARFSHAQTLNLPLRASNALGGQEFVKLITPLPAPPDIRREDLIYAQVTGGNVPDWMRKPSFLSISPE